MPFLAQVGGKESSDRRLVIDDEKLGAFAVEDFHRSKISSGEPSP
jgi:hypothetical protein